MTERRFIADRVIVGENIHPVATGPGPGFVAVVGGRIVAVETSGGSPEDLVGPRTEVVDAGSGTVAPGLHDNHTFFTSQLLEHGGIDAAGLGDDDVRTAARSAGASGDRLFLRGVEAERASRMIALIEDADPGIDAIVLARDRATIELSSAARSRLGGVDPGSNESLHAVYAQIAQDPDVVRAAFLAAADRMHRGGVTSVKDIAFDTHLGMLPVIDGMLAEGELAVRYAFASQPVAEEANLGAAAAWRDRPGARFHGFKLMTDGSFDEGTADLLPPDDAWRAQQVGDVDYAALRAEAERILSARFALALNADGDGAVRACVGIFEEYAKLAGGLPEGCSISDASLVSNLDAERIAELGLFVETYPQMLRFAGYTGEMLDGILGPDRVRHLCNLAALRGAEASVSAGTDFPLFEPSLPEAMLSASERFLGVGEPSERWYPERGVEREAVLDAWTAAAAAAMGQRGEWGALTEGAAADVVVFDRDLLSVAPEGLAEAAPALVLAGGAVVHAG